MLTDEELKQAIAEKILHPDVKRDELQRWRRSRNLGHLSSPNEAASDSAGSKLIAPIHAVGSRSLPSTTSGDDDRESHEEASAPEAVATAKEIAGPVTPSPNDDDIPAFLDRRPLSPDDQRAFDAIMSALNSASAVVRERIIAEVIRANASGYVPGRGEARSGRRAQAPQTEEGVGSSR